MLLRASVTQRLRCQWFQLPRIPEKERKRRPKSYIFWTCQYQFQLEQTWFGGIGIPSSELRTMGILHDYASGITKDHYTCILFVNKLIRNNQTHAEVRKQVSPEKKTAMKYLKSTFFKIWRTFFLKKIATHAKLRFDSQDHFLIHFICQARKLWSRVFSLPPYISHETQPKYH